MALATGIQLADSNPILGYAVTATLTVDTLPPYEIESTTWTYTINYGGLSTTRIAADFSDDTSATIYTAIPGDYLVRAVTTYTSTNPSAPAHSPTTFTAIAHVSPPISAIPNSGFGSPIPVYTATTAVSDINSAGGMLGPYVSGWVQEWIPDYLDYNGLPHPFQSDWWPPGGSVDTFDFVDSTLRDRVLLGDAMVAGNGVNWSSVPDGSVVASYDQRLRYAWRMTYALPGGGGGVMVFTTPLNGLSWDIIKVSADTWMLQLA